MSPSINHEMIKKTLARRVEAWADELELDLVGFGSWTVRAEEPRRGAEPDECYCPGGPDTPDRPDLALEMNWTHGGLDKLDVWRGLHVQEVWIWTDDRIDVLVLEVEHYAPRARSELLPQFNLVLLAEWSRMRQPDAVRALRAHVRGA